MTKKARGLEAPFAAADAVGAAIDLPFDEGLKKEREGFLKLVASDQSKAQRYAFFSEREAAKVAGVPDGTKPRNVERVAIIGAGTMGGGIAMSFANAGIPVTLIETGEEQLKRGMGVMQKNYEATAARGGIPADAPAKRMGLITGKVGLENVKDADLVIEAVFETMAIKKEVFEALDKYAKPGAVLASNTSYLNIDEIAKVTKRPQDVLGMHFFSPANVMKLCEIVRADKTAPDALTTAVAVARKIAKVPAVVGVCDGFVGNRMLAQRGKQSEKLLFEGALPQQVDAVVTKFGMPMGPFAMSDLAGLDIGWRSRKDRGIKSEIADALCEAGRFGQKTGKGYYKYEAGSRAALPDPEVEKLIDETLQRLGRKKRVVSDDEILERMMYPMINEGARILEEKIAARPSDIDVIWLYGYGWPIYRGGPMFYADQVGLKHIADRLSYYAKETNDPSLEPSPLLKRLAAEGKTFASLAQLESGVMGAVPPARIRDVALRCGPCRVKRETRGTSRFRVWPASRTPRNDGSPLRLAESAHDPPRRTILSGRRPLGRSDRARHAARSAVGGGGRIRRAAGDRIPRPADQLRRTGSAWSRSRPAPSCAPATAATRSVALFLGNSPDHPVNFFGALKAGARIVHLSPLDGEIALSHKLRDSGARVLVTSNLSTLLPTALKFLDKGLLDRLIVCEDDDWGTVGNAADAAAGQPRDHHLQAIHRRRGAAGAMARDHRPMTSRCCNIPAAPPACRRAPCSATAI